MEAGASVAAAVDVGEGEAEVGLCSLSSGVGSRCVPALAFAPSVFSLAASECRPSVRARKGDAVRQRRWERQSARSGEIVSREEEER